MKKSVVDTLTIGDLLRLAGRPQPDRRGLIACPSPQHWDQHPSAHVQPSGRGVRCFGCGWHGGILDVAIALGLGRDRAGAARALEASFGRR